MTAKGVPLHIQTTSDPIKSFAQYDELRKTGKVARAVILTESSDGKMNVLGQGLALEQMAVMLLNGMQGLAGAMEQAGIARPAPPGSPAARATGYAGVPGGRLNAQWRCFAEAAIPFDAPEVQRVSMRRAFYGGGQALLGIVMSGLTEGDEPQPEDLDKMDRLEAELKDFAKAVMEGKA